MSKELAQFYSLCLQGDVNSAVAFLRSLPSKTEEMEALEARFASRFFSPPHEEISANDNFIRNVIYCYHDYFRAVLTNQTTVEAAEMELVNKISRILHAPSSATIDSLEEALAVAFKERGYHFLGGVTPPFRGPYIWREERVLEFEVELPFAKRSVTVHMMSDFLLESWIGFATCENKHVGGWAKDNALFCNAICYKDLQAAEFQISYLKHEAQHMDDFLHFPHLTPADLEYRAKLVELIYSADHQVLNKFLLEAKNDPQFPHPFASYRILNNLSRLVFEKEVEKDVSMWAKKEYSAISAAAFSLYENDTNELKQNFGYRVKQFL